MPVLCLGLACAWLLPYHTFPYWFFYADYVAIASVVLATLVALSRQGTLTAIVPPTVVLPLVVAGLILTQAMTGHMAAPWDAAIAIGYLLATAAAMSLPFNLFRIGSDVARLRAWDLLCMTLVVTGTISTFIAFCQYLGVDDRLGDWTAFFNHHANGQSRPYANLGQPNQLALMLCWSLTALWWLYQTSAAGNVIASLLAAVLLAGLAVTQSKISWIILPTLGVTFFFGNRVVDVRRVSLFAIVALAMLFATMLFGLPKIGALYGTVTQSVGDRMQTNGVRMVMIVEGFYAGWQHFWTGVGWGGYGSAQIAVATRFGDTQYSMHAHNLVANLAAETGWVFTSLFCLTIVWWLYYRFVRLPLSRERILALAILSAVGLHSMVEFPLWYAYVIVPVGLVVGLVEASALSQAKGERLWTISRNALVVIALLGALCLAALATDYRSLVQSFRAFGFGLVGLSYQDGSVERPRFTAFPQQYDYLEFAGFEPRAKMSLDAIANAERVAHRFGYAPVLMRLSTIYALNGRPDDAVRMIAAMRKLYPQRYMEIYKAWKALADDNPELLAPVFERLEIPDRLLSGRHR